jgi:hypothetical protein
LILNHSIGEYLELTAPNKEAPLWRYVYGGKPKPFFHPLSTPAGFCLSLFEPSDHVWHRGLWFTIKYINGENFWEENDDFGVQRGLLPPAVMHAADGTIAFTQPLLWERPNRTGSVFAENRSITYRPLDFRSYALDWDIALTAQADLLLNRTPFTTWGGYGGLTIRGNRNWSKTHILFPDGSASDRPTGIPAQWTDLSGLFDGGAQKEGGIALFDHPANIRHPQPWYGATGSGHYVNAAFLFHEPLNIAKDETLRLRYRCLVHDNLWSVELLQRAYDMYTGEAVK